MERGAQMVAIQRTEQEKDALVAQYIAQDSSRAGLYNAYIVPHGPAVYMLISQFWAVNGGNVALAAADYDLTDEAVEAALAYYERHQAAIDARIEAHLAAFEQPL